MKKKLIILILMIFLIAGVVFLCWYKSENTEKTFNRTLNGVLVNTDTWEVSESVILNFDGTLKHTHTLKENYMNYSGIFSANYEKSNSHSVLSDDCICTLPILKGQKSSTGSFYHMDYESTQNSFQILGFLTVKLDSFAKLVFTLPQEETDESGTGTISSNLSIIAPAKTAENAKEIYDGMH